MARRWCRIALVIGLLGPVTATAQSATLNGTVVDSEGATIASAYVLVHHDVSGSTNRESRQDITRTTDTRGRFRVELQPGFYDACFMATGFTPQCQKVFVKGAKGGEMVVRNIRLRIDPLVVKELADKF
jgi:carboxypeptidase family protein